MRALHASSPCEFTVRALRVSDITRTPGYLQGGSQAQVSGLNFGNRGDLSLTGGAALAGSNRVRISDKEMCIVCGCVCAVLY